VIVHKLPADRQAAIAMFLGMVAPGKVFVLQTIHDDFCKAITTQRDADCSPRCSPEHYILEVEPGDAIELDAGLFADARNN
jgi:hypothetical protein